MRKQNSIFQTGFLSEAGSELENNDYFACVELDNYACYVAADGLNSQQDAKSARIATQSVILAFQEKPSLGKRAIRSYLKAADKALCQYDSRERLKASVMVVVTDYEKMRYGWAGNTRLRMYRDGQAREQSQDMSLGSDETKEKKLPEDVLAKHEERNNLYGYAGQGKGFSPCLSKKISLEKGDILAVYTRGIWENLDSGELDDVFSEAKEEPSECLDNVEDLLLSRQPENLENYTLAAIFVNKVFQDPERKRKRKKRMIFATAVFAVLLCISLGVWFFRRWRQKQEEELEQRFSNMIEYIQDANFVRAGEECKEAQQKAEKLRKKKELQKLSDYQKLIEVITGAEEAFDQGEYEEAQEAYVTARQRSRYADRIAESYIEKRLGLITDYRSVFDYIQLGDMLTASGDYDRAEEKYLYARKLATGVYFEEGRQDALDALDTLYEMRNKAEEADTKEAKEKAWNETGAASLASEGDKAFDRGDYEGAKAYYVMALEKYQELGDQAHGDLIQTKIQASGQKSEENKGKEQMAEDYLAAGKVQEEAGDRLEAKKQYLLAKNLFRELKKDEKVAEVNGQIELLEAALEQEKEKEEAEQEKEDLEVKGDQGKEEVHERQSEDMENGKDDLGMVGPGSLKKELDGRVETRTEMDGPGVDEGEAE